MRARPPDSDLDLDQELALLFSETGELLWWSPAWHPPGSAPCNPAEHLGRRWEEFVHPDDLDGFRFWLLDGDCDLHCYRFWNTSARSMMRMWIIKVPAGRDWLCLGQPVALEPDYAPDAEVSGRMLIASDCS